MNIIIEKEKITNYLLVRKDKNDKSKFLNDLGFEIENWEELKSEILNIAKNNETIFQSSSPFGGDLVEITGKLRKNKIVTIWLLRIDQDTLRFITLFPKKQ